MFRDRPLTWLFVIATICVDLVMMVPAFGSRMIFMFGIPAQLSLIAIWGAIGKSHRLARGAVVTLAVFLATVSVTRFPYDWSDLLTFYLVHILLVFCGTLILRSFGWLRRWPSLVDRENEKFRYSVIEMFGWTTVAAIWAFAFRHATTGDDFYTLYFANFTTIPIITVALVCRSRWRYLAILILAALAIAILSVRFITGRFDLVVGPTLLWGNLTQVTYLGIWYAVQCLDLSRMNSSTPLKLHQE